MTQQHLEQAFQKSGFVKWREASKNPAKARWIKWGKIKTPERAIEKAFRSYKVAPSNATAPKSSIICPERCAQAKEIQDLAALGIWTSKLSLHSAAE